jgi:hypothetical protein
MVAAVSIVIAILGTSVYFIQGDSINSLVKDLVPPGDQESSVQEQVPQAPVQQQEVQQVFEEPVVEEEQVVVQHCDALGMDSQPLDSNEECLKVYNAHTWVSREVSSATINERSTTAFVVENTGEKAITVTSIYLRSVPVPAQDWHFTKDPAAVRPDNLLKELPADFKESAVLFGNSLAVMETGAITLEPAQAAIVYLNEAGGVTEKDAGLTIILQLQTPSVQTIIPVQVVAS